MVERQGGWQGGGWVYGQGRQEWLSDRGGHPRHMSQFMAVHVIRLRISVLP